MTLRFAIQLAKPKHAFDISAMSRDYVEQGLDWGWTYARVLSAINDPDTNVAVVGDPGSLLAFGIMSYAEDHAHLQLFAVRRAAQRKGIGSGVLTWLERVAHDAGSERIILEARQSNHAARSFYSAHGYREQCVEPAMYQGVEPGVRFEKWLRARDA